jgi:hypothetical protein
MSLEVLNLPKNKQQLAQLLKEHADREEVRLSFRRMTWLVALFYMWGARRFDTFDPDSGSLTYSYLDDEGRLEFQSTEFLSAVDRIVGRLTAMDLRPLVQRVGNSLDAIRERSIAQIIGDSVVSEQQLEQVKSEYVTLFTLLGSCGVAGHMMDHPTIGLAADLEVVHPKELFPFPSLGQDYTRQLGLMRQRFLPVETLQRIFGRRIRDNLNRMEWFDQVTGDSHEAADFMEPFGGGLNLPDPGPRITGSGVVSRDDDTTSLVKTRELWVWGPRRMCLRYVVASGDYVIVDEDTSDTEVYCPVGFGRFMENGSFHGAGAFDLLFPLSREAEKLQKALFQNIRDVDQYGVLVMPHGSFNANTMLRDVGRGLRVFPWEPDPISEGFRPFSIQPFNTGDVPGRVAQFALQGLDRVNPVRDLIREKGRVDSQVGLSFLDEQVNRAMTTPTRGVQRAFGEMYRSLIHEATGQLAMSPRAMPVERLSTDLAGAVIDPRTMQVRFSDNPLPTNISRLSFGVREVNPRSEVVRKQEAVQLLQMFQGTGEMTKEDFILFALKEGLDFAMWTDEHQAAYDTVVRNVLLLFGDGEEPGEVIVTPQTSRPDMQLRVLTAFMSSPVMAVADSRVQDAFITYHDTLKGFMGMVLPEGVPNPDDEALLRQIEQANAPALMAAQGV